ncbi:ankyrin repeat domain-containing protein [Wolbachia endosymbiont (group A) of Rhinocyllus conicus]|uniref:ankyrin repeat domain-containing protein n=1 Tax=Wolbachia endosymbiont (group A) of Rhinocyllus conicus TaxID=2954053 RepID=UPI0022261581|nr:ankyrin repeat domain-containing protein [Wolbachia endosymbiont (group A) of Rhinocyllus conicus]
MSANLSLELIKCLINQQGVDVNVRGLNGKTPLHYAVEINELSMVALLLNRKNINPLITDDDGKSALSCAREEILQALINHKYGLEKDSLLHLAAMLNEANAVRFLLNKGVNVNEQNALLHTPLHLAAGAGHEGIVEILIREGNADKDVLDVRNHAAMHYAVNNKKLEVVKLLSNLGANVNIAGSGRNAMKLSPLHVAISGSNYDERDLCLDIVRCLINVPNAGVNLQDYENKTPLHYAERLKTVEVLLTREDIDPLIKDDNGKTPFCYAKEENKSEIVKALISNRYGVEKNNLLHLAAKKGYGEILGAILKEGVEVDVLNDQGESAVYLAAINRHFNIVKLLLKKRADATDVFEYAITTNNVKLVKLLNKEKDIVLFGKNDNFPTFHLLSNKYFEERKIADKKIKKCINIICVSITVCAIAIVGIYPNIIAAVMVGIVALIAAIIMSNLIQKYIEEALEKKMFIELESEKTSSPNLSDVEISSNDGEELAI